jgi:hypothetical protein
LASSHKRPAASTSGALGRVAAAPVRGARPFGTISASGKPCSRSSAARIVRVGTTTDDAARRPAATRLR